MKCPECDSHQPDNAATCSECGLSFEVWREMNPIEASVQGDDMAFPETPEDPAPDKGSEGTLAPEASAEKTEGPLPAKGPQEKKSPPLALIGGVLGGLAVIGALIFFLMKPSVPTTVPAESVAPTPAQMIPSASPSTSPTFTVVPATPTMVKSVPLSKPAAAEPTRTSTPKPKPTPTATPEETVISLDEEEPQGTPSPQESLDPVAAKAEASSSHSSDLLGSAEPSPQVPPSPHP